VVSKKLKNWKKKLSQKKPESYDHHPSKKNPQRPKKPKKHLKKPEKPLKSL
jgi:hypothetical protein